MGKSSRDTLYNKILDVFADSAINSLNNAISLLF